MACVCVCVCVCCMACVWRVYGVCVCDVYVMCVCDVCTVCGMARVCRIVYVSCVYAVCMYVWCVCVYVSFTTPKKTIHICGFFIAWLENLPGFQKSENYKKLNFFVF